jgi:hypothetical protein
VAQGLLPFQYESESGEAGLTGLAGLPLYLELWRAAGLDGAVARHVVVSGAQGRSADGVGAGVAEPCRG